MQASFETPFGVGSVVVEGGALREVRLPQARDESPPAGLRSRVGGAAFASASADPAPGGAAREYDPPGAAEESRTQRSLGAGATEPGVDSAGTRCEGDTAAAERWARALESYLAGEGTGWSLVDVDLAALAATPFHEEVYRALLRVPAGSVVTYGELARRAGRPGAARAVGGAMARNPIAVVVPCHRVVRGDGSLGEYGFGTSWKRRLLEMEGALAGDGGGEAPRAAGAAGRGPGS